MKNEPRLTLLRAATEFHTTREILRRALNQANIRPGKDKKYSIDQIFRALNTPEHRAKIRLTHAQAEKIEHRIRVMEDNLVPVSEVREFILTHLRLLTDHVKNNWVQSAPQLNPKDPEHARQIMQREVDNFSRFKAKLPDEPVKRSKTKEY